MKSYHDVEVEWEEDGKVKRGQLSRLSYGLRLTCTRTGGWELWNAWERPRDPVLVAGEFGEPRLKVYVKGERIV